MNVRAIVRIAALGIIAAACGSGSSTGGLDLEASYLFSLTPGNEVPAPKPTTASGTAQLFVYPDRIDYQASANSITGLTMSHIHNGAPGVAGPVVVTLFQATTPLVNVNGTFTTGSITQATLGTSVTLGALKALLASGNAYVNVHTLVNPAGEIRGQVR